MRTPDFLYDFGISQDDPLTEMKALDLMPGDRVLCIASAGEVPLDLLVSSDDSIEIDAADINEQQLYLSNLKRQAAIILDDTEAARFLGYIPADTSSRLLWFNRIKDKLPQKEAQFWIDNTWIFNKGPIQYGRYETYISRFAPVGRLLMGGRQKIMGLFDCTDSNQQKVYFDEVLKTGLLKSLFKLMFHKHLYRNRGIAQQGLIHMGEENVGIQFFQKFKDFCTNTLARENWYLQFMLFSRVLYEEALPDYLRASGRVKLKNGCMRLKLVNASFTDKLEESPKGYYNKFIFSNISDWLTEREVMNIMDLIAEKSGSNARGVIRYIHSPGINQNELWDGIKLEPEAGEQLLHDDRFPFYKILPFNISTISVD